MRTSLLAAFGAALLVSAASAQANILKEGDFENGGSAWTQAGPGGTPSFVKNDTNGDGQSSTAFFIRPGGNVYAPPHNPFILSQQVVGVPSIPHFFQADLQIVATNGNAQGGVFELWLDGQKVYEWTKYVGSISAGVNDRIRLSAVVTFPKANPTANVELHLARPRYIHSSSTPQMFIDDVSLRRASVPCYTHVRDVRKLGGQFSFELEGTPSAAGALFLSGAVYKAPIPISGIGGALELDLGAGFFFLGAAVLDAQGMAKLSMPIPNASGLLGLAPAFQSLQWDKSGLSLGPAQTGCAIN